MGDELTRNEQLLMAALMVRFMSEAAKCVAPIGGEVTHAVQLMSVLKSQEFWAALRIDKDSPDYAAGREVAARVALQTLPAILAANAKDEARWGCRGLN